MKNYTKWKIAHYWNPLLECLEDFISFICNKLTIKNKAIFPVRPDGSFYSWEEICEIHRKMTNEKKN